MADEPTAMADEPTAMADEPTAMPVPTAMTEAGARLRSEWTVDNPATREEIEAELAKYRGRSIVFSSWGGAYQSAQRQAYGVPFAEQFGIEIIDDSQPTVGRVRAMQESGNVAWHVFDTGGGSIHALANGGSLEELDFSIMTPGTSWKSLKLPTSVVAASPGPRPGPTTDIYPEGSVRTWPTSTTEKFPGRRSWSQFPRFPALKRPHKQRRGHEQVFSAQRRAVDRAFELFEEYRDQTSSGPQGPTARSSFSAAKPTCAPTGTDASTTPPKKVHL